MTDKDYHIYQVPRPARSQSFTVGCPTPPLPIHIPASEQTVYTQNQLYSLQLSTIPSSAPPTLPPRNHTTASRDPDSFLFPLPPPQSTPSEVNTAAASGTSPNKKRWKNSIPHFGSFKEKTRKAEYGPQLQTKRRFSAESVTPSSGPGQPQPGAVLTLGRLAENYPHCFPFQVRALQSYSFQASQLAITHSDVYNLLLVKQQQFVAMQDRLGMSYSIPLNSAVQFGYVNSSDRRSSPHTLAYKSYTKVGDLLALGDLEMPRIMCAQQAHKGQSGKCSVDENEVLLILRPRKSKLSGRRYLKVYSFTTRSRKNLHPDCVGHFTTNPAHLRLWLTDLVNVHANLFPCQAVIYLEKRFTSALKSFPSTLLQADSYVTLTGLTSQTSVVASRATLPPTHAMSQIALLDMPMAGLLSNLQVEVQTPSSSEALQSAARGAFEGLDLCSLQSLDDSISERAHTTKCLFYTILRRGCEQVGVNLLPPSSVKTSSQHRWSLSFEDTKTPTDSDQDSDSDLERYEKISDWVAVEPPSTEGHTLVFPSGSHTNTPTLSIGSQAYEMPPVQSASPSLSSGFHSFHTSTRHHPITSHSISSPQRDGPNAADEDYEMMESPTPPSLPDLQPFHYSTQNEGAFVDVSVLKRTVRMLENRVVPLERKVAEHHQLQALVRTLSLRITKLERQLMPPSTANSTSSHTTSSLRAANIAYLCSLTPSQVLELLDAMSLSHYKPTFHYMGLSGEKLSRYTDQQLESHVGVIPPADRERLRHIITGSLSAHELMMNHTRGLSEL